MVREEVKVPAGTFNAFRLEGRGRNTDPRGATSVYVTRWHVPELPRPVKREETVWRGGEVIYTQRLELVSYKLA